MGMKLSKRCVHSFSPNSINFMINMLVMGEHRVLHFGEFLNFGGVRKDILVIKASIRN